MLVKEKIGWLWTVVCILIVHCANAKVVIKVRGKSGQK